MMRKLRESRRRVKPHDELRVLDQLSKIVLVFPGYGLPDAALHLTTAWIVRSTGQQPSQRFRKNIEDGQMLPLDGDLRLGIFWPADDASLAKAMAGVGADALDFAFALFAGDLHHAAGRA